MTPQTQWLMSHVSVFAHAVPCTWNALFGVFPSLLSQLQFTSHAQVQAHLLQENPLIVPSSLPSLGPLGLHSTPDRPESWSYGTVWIPHVYLLVCFSHGPSVFQTRLQKSHMKAPTLDLLDLLDGRNEASGLCVCYI